MNAPVNRGYSAAPDGAAARGAVWSIAQNSGKHLLHLAIFLCLTRLLDPEAYGLLALAGAFVTLAAVLVEQGLGDALVQKTDLRPEHLDSAFWFTLGTAVLLAAACFAAAAPLASAFGQPRLVEILRWLSVLPLLHALSVVPQALLARHLSFGALALRTLLGLAAGGATGIGFALAGYGVYALVAQQLVTALVSATILWWRCGWRPGFRVHAARLAELHRFGRHILTTNLLDFVNRKSDDLIIGFFLGPVALGIYNIAYQLLLVMEQLLCKGFDALSLSVFSRLQEDRAGMREALYKAAQLSALVAFPAALGAASIAPEAVGTLFGAQWVESADVFRILAVVAAVHAVMHFNHSVFKACGVPAISVRLALIEAAINLPLFLLAVRYGISAVATCYTLRAFLLVPVCLVETRRLIGLDIPQFLRSLLAPALAAAVMVVALWMLLEATQHAWPASLRLAAGIVLGVLVYVLALRGIAPDLFRRSAAQLRDTVAAFRRRAGVRTPAVTTSIGGIP